VISPPSQRRLSNGVAVKEALKTLPHLLQVYLTKLSMHSTKGRDKYAQGLGAPENKMEDGGNIEKLQSVYIEQLLLHIREKDKDFSMLWGNKGMAILLTKERLIEEQELMKKWKFEQHTGTCWWYNLPTQRCKVTTEVWTSKDLEADDFSALAPLLGPNLPGGFIVHCKYMGPSEGV